MSNKEDVLQEIIDYYLESADFNGLPLYKMTNYDSSVLIELIDEDRIEAFSDKEVLNPHVRNCFIDVPKEVQKEILLRANHHTVIYPTKLALSNIQADLNKPFTAMMQKGTTHFDICYFNIEILEKYINNPKFIVFDNGYRGNIYVKDNMNDTDNENEYIKNWGMAYNIKNQKLERAVGAFVADLAKLDENKQSLWKGFLLTKQENYQISSGFFINLVQGKWVEDVWVFNALLDEMKLINQLCDAIKLPKLFNKTFGPHVLERPEGYRNIFLPTLKNYYDFVMVLEKVVIHNLSIKPFQTSVPLLRSIERKDSEGKDKGSLMMLEEWLIKNTGKIEDVKSIIIEPLKNIRKIRQAPAHELNANEYDIVYYRKQIDLIESTYGAIRNIRHILAAHPLAENIIIPEYLVTGESIVSY